jgi:hypothetical protein
MLDEREGDVTPQDLPMAFNRQPLWARAAIVSAGPLANLLLAVCLYAATFWVGQFETQATLAAPVVGSVADVAGLRSGDTILRAGVDANDLQDINSLDALRWWMMQQDALPIYLEVQAQGKQTRHVLRLAEVSENTLSKIPMLGKRVASQVHGVALCWVMYKLGSPHKLQVCSVVTKCYVLMANG